MTRGERALMFNGFLFAGNCALAAGAESGSALESVFLALALLHGALMCIAVWGADK